MATTTKKTIKSKNTKTVTGTGLKSKLPKSKWKLGFLSMAAFLLVTTVGYSGFVTWQGYQFKAKAENWTYVGKDGRYQNNAIWACKYVINSSFGPLYVVKGLFNRGNSPFSSAEIRANTAVATSSTWTSSPYGSYANVSILAGSIYNPANVKFNFYNPSIGGWFVPQNGLNPKNLNNC